MDWIAETLGEGPLRIVIWIAVVLGLALLGLLVLRLFRGLMPGLFIAGGGKRHQRLAVVDATAVDSRRRLVLIRRDDCEHLLLIGGPTDVVVEGSIKAMPSAAEPAAIEAAAPEAIARPQPRPARPEPVHVERPPAQQRPVPELSRPGPTPEAVVDAVARARTAEAQPERKPVPEAARPEPVRPQPAPPQVQPPSAKPPISAVPPPPPLRPEAPQVSATVTPPVRPADATDADEADFSDALRAVFDGQEAAGAAPRPVAAKAGGEDDEVPSLEEEMKRLLDQLSEEKSGT